MSVRRWIYDRLYDMALPATRRALVHFFPNSFGHRAMRETGVEPVSLSAPDPKSHEGISAPSNDAIAPEKLESDSTQRHTAPPTDAQTTTKTTTCPGERFTYRPDATLEPIGHEAGEECTVLHHGIGSSLWVQFADASSHPVLRHELEPIGGTPRRGSAQ